MALEGKGFFTWQIDHCENGNYDAIASLARQANLTHVLIKIADGAYSVNIAANGEDMALRLSQALRAQGIRVLGWHYIYGNDPLGEAHKAIQRIQQINVDMYVIDAESEFKQPGKNAAATQFMNQMRSALPAMPMALSSFRWPSLHPEFPWNEFLSRVDYNMPQVYWMQAHNPAAQLQRSVNEFRAMQYVRPIIPTGAAFREHGWQSTPAEVLEFLQKAKDLNLSAANFWEWSDARSGILPGVWEVIRDFPWTPPKEDITQLYIDALNSHTTNTVTGLYAANAVQITSARTIQGTAALTAWYQQMFTQLLPDATFTLTGYSQASAMRHFNWTATSSHGNVNNGNDTFGLLNDKIVYHYSFFTITP